MSDKTPTGLGREPAPSSPDRIEAAKAALWVTERFPVDENDVRLPSRDHPDFVRMDMVTYPSVEAVVAALDAYDREHPTPEVERLSAMVEWLCEVIVDAREALVEARRQYVGDLRGSRPPGRVPVDLGPVLAILDRERTAHPSALDRVTHERDQAARDLATLRERIATEIEAERDRIRKQYESWLHVHMGAVEPGSRDYDSEVAMDTLTTAARLVREAAEVTA